MGELEDVIEDLYNALEAQPSSVYFHERLLEAWIGLGEQNMASGIATALLQIDPTNKAARDHLGIKRGKIPQRTSSDSGSQNGVVGAKPKPDWEWPSDEKYFEESYSALKLEAKLLNEEIFAVGKHAGITSDEQVEILSKLQAISEGHVSAAVKTAQPVSVREVARDIMETPKEAKELIVDDFETVVRWGTARNPPLGPDEIRERLVKRKALLEAALPASMEKMSDAALAQIEREHLQKRYVNTETMLGDKIEDIPRENFFVSEDNYAWDMEELAQALASNDGVMRNPLSKEMFSESDIRKVLDHPLGQRLKPLRVAQSELKKGVRPTTIKWIEKLGRIMLADQTADAATSRVTMDEFLAYVATLPEAEQKTINSLKIPGADKNTGQAYDYTIGESVRDAKSNTTCFHKVGDFLSQAAAYLRRM